MKVINDVLIEIEELQQMFIETIHQNFPEDVREHIHVNIISKTECVITLNLKQLYLKCIEFDTIELPDFIEHINTYVDKDGTWLGLFINLNSDPWVNFQRLKDLTEEVTSTITNKELGELE